MFDLIVNDGFSHLCLPTPWLCPLLTDVILLCYICVCGLKCIFQLTIYQQVNMIYCLGGLLVHARIFLAFGSLSLTLVWKGF